ncbi:hypothetical protein [uncultured Empedobacter sp.]|uniref:hypothetical protein n=1 Tax=uncultured Empedobacter sp. TaxID=410844 RepID=UPI0025D6A41B|nr:hypothetical protein [uncultured Empedobacter sp.]
MHTGTKNIITCFVLATFILYCIFGCGKRTTSFERTEIKKDSLRIYQEVQLTQNATWSDIGKIKPFDPLKPMLWNGAWHYNTIIEFDKSIKKGIEIKANDNLSYTGSESETKNKETVSNNKNFLWIGLSFVIGILFVLYLSLKKHNLI